MSDPVTPTPISPAVAAGGASPPASGNNVQQTPSLGPNQCWPNYYSLGGNGITIQYGWFGSPDVMSYQDSTYNLTFTSDRVTLIDVPALGTLISVTIAAGTDTTTTFNFVLPPVVIPGQSGDVGVDTFGISAVQTKSASSTSPQTTTYTAINLSGTAVSTGNAPL